MGVAVVFAVGSFLLAGWLLFSVSSTCYRILAGGLLLQVSWM